jgi:carbon storage regulator
MLIMTRRPGEALAIGEDVVVRIMAIEGGRVQLGIDAPKDVKVRVVEPSEGPEIQRK